MRPVGGVVMELVTGVRFAGYVIEGVAGRGGMGVVYRARQLRPSRVVGLKVISPELVGDRGFRERFVRESEVAASIEHSHVIPVYEVGEVGGRLFIAMRFVEGADLGRVVGVAGRLGPGRAVGILAQLTSALDAAHARGLVHRDVKPANVLIAREGGGDHVYLTDFGLAKFVVGGGVTRTGMFVGTLDYAAPEQLEGRGVDARTDVYAAGCVLYNMLTGAVPFPREGEAAVMWAHLSAGPPSVRELVPELPAEFDAVIARAMAKNPADRYPSAGDLGRDALAAAERQRATVAERSVATGRAAPRSGSAPHPQPPAGGAPLSPVEPFVTEVEPAPRESAAATALPAPTVPVVTEVEPAPSVPLLTEVAPRAVDPDSQATVRAGTPGRGGPADPPQGRAPAGPARRRRPRGLIAAITAGGVIAVAVIVLVASGVFSSSGTHDFAATSSSRSTQTNPPTTATTATTAATKMFTDRKLGVSFAYPANWNQLTESQTVADFGIGAGAAQTACALVFLPSQGPASRSQEARLGYVRGQTAFAATKNHGFHVLAIQAEQGANIAGVGYLATSDAEDYHAAFFFAGRNVYVISCITPPGELTQVDQQAFQPLIASVTIG